jgi:Pentapeptide repeats (9 copies)
VRIASNEAGIERRLLQANSWLQPFQSQLGHALEAAANGQASADDPVRQWGQHALTARRTATLERLRAGYGTWRRWADTLQQLREELAQRPGLSACLSSICAADLGSHTFAAHLDASGFVWPTRVSFAEATFGQDAWFTGCIFHDGVDFSAARFLASAAFERSRFGGGADFSAAFFAGASEFRLCAFEKEARFGRARFAGDAWFRGSRFAGSASFAEAAFQGEAGFGASAFRGDADFSAAAFADNAGFEESAFGGRALFAGARFARNTWFVGNSFATPPSFDRAHFAGRVRFDDGIPVAARSPVHRQLALIEAAMARGMTSGTSDAAVE